MVDRPASRYPYSRDGVIAVPAQADWLDPMIALSFAAAASSRVDVATGVLLLPEHNPVIVAKEAASLDRLSGRRLTLGVASDGPRRRDDVASFDGNSRVVIVANCGWPWPWLILRLVMSMCSRTGR